MIKVLDNILFGLIVGINLIICIWVIVLTIQVRQRKQKKIKGPHVRLERCP